MESGDHEALMSLHDVARYLAMTDRTIYDWAQTGRIPAFKLGATWRFRRSEIDAWLLSQRSGPDVSPSDPPRQSRPTSRLNTPLVPPTQVEPTHRQRVEACKAEIESTISDPTRTTFLASQFDDEFGANVVSEGLEELRKERRVTVSTMKGRDGERIKVVRRRS